MDNIEEVAYS